MTNRDKTELRGIGSYYASHVCNKKDIQKYFFCN